MKYKKLFIFTIFFVLFLGTTTEALAATLYLSPASGTIGTGRIKQVQIRVNAGGDAINGVSAYLSYPANKLQVTSISYGGSFSVPAEGSSGGGGIRISRGSYNNVTGDVVIATINFKGLAEGPATVSFIGGSQTTRSSDSSDSVTGKTGGSYTVAFAAPEPTKAPEAGPLISNVTSTNIGTNSATITWTTDNPADSVVEYGLEKGQYLLTQTPDESTVTPAGAKVTPAGTTTHSVILNSPALIPGITIHYRVRSKTAGGGESISADSIFQLKGYTLQVKVHSQEGLPVTNTQVVLYSDPKIATTDANGIATFENVTAGTHVVVVKLGSYDNTAEVTIIDSPTPQQTDITVTPIAATASTDANNNLLLYGALAASLVAIIVILAFFLHQKKSEQVVAPPPPQY